MGRHIFLSMVLLALCCPLRARADLEAEMAESARKLQPILQSSAAQLAEGKVDEIDQQILTTFPEKSRTPAQALILGNVLYKQDPKISYALHKQAAEKLPDEPMSRGCVRCIRMRSRIVIGPAITPGPGLATSTLPRNSCRSTAISPSIGGTMGRGANICPRTWSCLRPPVSKIAPVLPR